MKLVAIQNSNSKIHKLLVTVNTPPSLLRDLLSRGLVQPSIGNLELSSVYRST